MIFLLILIIVIIGTICLFRIFSDSETKTKIVFNEDKLVKKFNHLVKSIRPRNVETIKKELLECLEDYRAVKKQQFVEARTLITESIASIENEIKEVEQTCCKKQNYLRENKTHISELEGAKLCYEIDLYKQMSSKLSMSKDLLNKQLLDLDKKIMSFNTKLQVKRTQILSMINTSIVIDDNSVIDLRLDSLEKEFKHETNKIEQSKIVDEKMGNTKKEEELSFDVEHYIKMFKEF